MGVRLRITGLFSIIVLIILAFVCGSVYFFSYQSRIHDVKTRLTNRAITTARLLSQSELFDRNLVRKIDSATTLSLVSKTIQVYDSKDDMIYAFSDVPGDTLPVNNNILDRARGPITLYFTAGEKDVIACHVSNKNLGVVMIAGAIDKDGKEKLKQLRLIILFSFIGGLLVSLAGGYFFSGGLLRPIKKIADEVNEISARNLTRRINRGNVNDEWNYLSSTLNELLNRLQESFELQGRFIANASHELLTPLTSISSQLEVSLQRERTADHYHHVMQSIYLDVRHLSRLTQMLLEFAKASGNTTGINTDLVRIDEILLQLPGEMAKEQADYSVTLFFDSLPVEDQGLLIFGNGELLFVAIKNIVSNACKYSADHKARVSLAITGSEIIIKVTDKGRGIGGDEIKKIFQPFYRAGDGSVPGFGLGLSLSSRIIKLHKGNIQAASELNTGTTFTIQLPAATYPD
ncbi:MAG: HAMP domain-containing sensor histidine kinase [Bacteroidota bacterium]